MRLYRRNEVGALEFKALSTTGVAFDYSESDEKTVFFAVFFFRRLIFTNICDIIVR